MSIASGLTTAILVAVVVVSTHVAASVPPPSMLNGPALMQAKSPGGAYEGIRVHGHWVIEVRNPDGSLADRREIQNGLSVAGAPLLAALLTRTVAAGYWVVSLAGNGACAGSPGNACHIQQTRPAGQPGNYSPGPGVSDTLTVAMGADQRSVVLQGNVTATGTGFIDLVITDLGACTSTTAPANCTSFSHPFPSPWSVHIGSTEFTRRLFGFQDAPPAVNVLAGQIIQVTVTISFS
jgi:hypothetical protein